MHKLTPGEGTLHPEDQFMAPLPESLLGHCSLAMVRLDGAHVLVKVVLFCFPGQSDTFSIGAGALFLVLSAIALYIQHVIGIDFNQLNTSLLLTLID